MDCCCGGGPIKGMAERFSINGHHFTTGGIAEGGGPGDKAAGQFVRVQSRQDSSKGVMTGNTMWQLQEVGEPRLLRLAVLLNVFPPLRSTDHRTHRNDEDIHQQMTAIGG